MKTPTPPLHRINPQVRAIEGYHLKAYDCPIKLNQNESPFDVPEDLKAQILQTVSTRPWSRYPDPMPLDLAAALADHVNVSPNQVIVCNGSNTLVQLFLALTTHPDAPVVIPSPSFSLYGLYTGLFNGRAISVPLTPAFTFDVPAIQKAIHKENAHTVILCSPNNPTGCAISNDNLKALLSQTDALVLLDEAYGEFSDHTALDLLPEHPNLVVLKTFSKAFGAAGIRIGYLIAHPDITQEILKGKIPFDINLFSYTAAMEIVQEKKLIQERIDAILAERQRLFHALQALNGARPYPSQANLILFEVEDPEAVFNGLVEQGVLIRNVTSYPMLSKALRVSIGTQEENDCFLKALEKTLREIP